MVRLAFLLALVLFTALGVLRLIPARVAASAVGVLVLGGALAWLVTGGQGIP